MKYNIIIFFFVVITTGCTTLNIFTDNDSINSNNLNKNVSKINYENFSAKGVVKFEVKNQKISSRFNFIKNKSYEEIVFLDIFNNSIISFEIKSDEILIKESQKEINSESLKEILNRKVFKKIILNFSSILTGKIDNNLYLEKYENGLYKIIKNNNYSVYYKMYNSELLPVIMKVDFFNVLFDLKIVNWNINK
tara:strand:- start:584 stop:1162 length:579 start_codon:yes stop_codon:yes gene_type:complete